MKKALTITVLLLAVVGAGCGSSNPRNDAQHAAEDSARHFVPYIPGDNNTEQRNYNASQKLYNDPSTIIWCTAFPLSNAQPLVTVPIAGKLTSSTTTAFNPVRVYNGDGDSNPVVPAPSVDGLYHPDPPPYRYGFTPGGQYVDFFNMPTLCTTQPLEFQRQSVTVKVASDLDAATQQAEQALKKGDKQEAQAILEGATE